MIVVFSMSAPVGRKFGCVWPYIAHPNARDAIVELMAQYLQSKHGSAIELPTWEGEA